MIPKVLDQITEADLQDLATNKVAEGTLLEYKATLPAASDGERIKFLRALSSFANTQGGDLIYGIQATQGIPTAIPGLGGVNEDAERLRLENLCRDGLQERLRNIHMRFVPLASGTPVLIVRVPRSWNGPHRVILSGHGHFYGRNSAGSFQLDVPQLRSAFLLGQSVADRIRAFREQRLAQIAANAAPVRLEAGAVLVFHAAPLEAFTEAGFGRLQLTKDIARRFSPPNVSGISVLPNFDGHCVYYGGDGPFNTYSQVFRSGVVEYVAVFNYEERHSKKPGIPAHWIEDDCIKTATTYTAGLQELGVPPPYYLMLSLLSVKEHVFDAGDYFLNRGRRADRDNLVFPEVAVEDLPFDAPQTLMPLFDLLWQSFGHEHSNSYDKKGNFARQRR